MKRPDDQPLVTTIKERCRICYTCVRECPAKAIRIAEGQAEVLGSRCVGCGNCVRVCSQNAKSILDAVRPTERLLAGEPPVAAVVAPSFPADFTDCTWKQFVGMLRTLGFDRVCEVAFGADLVADRYRRLLDDDPLGRYIATSCPAIVGFIERYHPGLVDSLAPIVSPMVAAARVLHELHGPDLKIVFVGPCVAKKGEALSEWLPGEVNAALTFKELREMLDQADIVPGGVAESDFDPPHAGTGSLFPISRGLLQAAEIKEDLLTGDVVAADGETFVDAIKEFQSGHLNAQLLEVLACRGCIMGPGVVNDDPAFSRRQHVSEFARERMARFDPHAWAQHMKRFEQLDLSRSYHADDQRLPVPDSEEVRAILRRMGKSSPQDELNCGACGYPTCREHAVAILKGLAESEMCLPHTIEKLHLTIGELAESNQQLASTQEALIQSEKLASMGQLAAGIAHEVNNPLGVVLMYAHLMLEETEENTRTRDDLSLIAEQADRCKKIVSGLLNFARQNKVLREATDARDLAERVLKALPRPTNIELAVDDQLQDPIAELDRDQVSQVLTNLVTNAYGAMDERGGTLTVRLSGDPERVRFEVSDTGVGIPEANRQKIFEPFFTTKQMGKGTGLGLAVTYGIVKMHGGDIRVESNDDPAAGATGTAFTVTIPRKGKRE